MSRMLVISALPVLALLERLKADGHEVPEGVELVTVDPNDPEWRKKADAIIAEGVVGDIRGIHLPAKELPDMPFQDEHLEETPDRKLAAQLSPRQVVLPPHLRQRRL